MAPNVEQLRKELAKKAGNDKKPALSNPAKAANQNDRKDGKRREPSRENLKQFASVLDNKQAPAVIPPPSALPKGAPARMRPQSGGNIITNRAM